jgi:hypothetical protein
VPATGADLYFLRARYYDPATGRFIAKDFVEFDQRYAYVDNNPANYVDPLGLCGLRDPWDCAVDAVTTTTDAAGDALECVGTLGRCVLEDAPINVLLAGSIDFDADCARTVSKEGINFHYGCGGWAETFLIGVDKTAFTVGNDVFTFRTNVSDRLRRHEACHVGQYDRFGGGFLLAYVINGSALEDAARWAAANTSSLSESRQLCAGGARAQ